MKESCTVDFRLVGDTRGIYFEETHRCLVFLTLHESLEDIYKTVTHEVIHHCVEQCGVQLDEDQEEKLIFQFQWAEHSLV